MEAPQVCIRNTWEETLSVSKARSSKPIPGSRSQYQSVVMPSTSMITQTTLSRMTLPTASSISREWQVLRVHRSVLRHAHRTGRYRRLRDHTDHRHRRASRRKFADVKQNASFLGKVLLMMLLVLIRCAPSWWKSTRSPPMRITSSRHQQSCKRYLSHEGRCFASCRRA